MSSSDNDTVAGIISVNHWDKRYLDMAQHISLWSKDPSTKVGAVIVDKDFRPVSFGVNGLPQKIKEEAILLDDRETKYKTIIHAEVNAILFAKTDLSNCTIYTWPFQPCSRCASVIIQSGITRIVTCKSDNERWKDDFDLSLNLLNQANIVVDFL